MFDQVIATLKKATEATVQVQQEMFKKWVSLWPGAPAWPLGGEPAQQVQKKWTECVNVLVKQQCETLEAQFKVGLKNIEEAFRLAEAKSPEELRVKTVELWRKSFECLKQTYEAQVRDSQAALARWTELALKGAA